MQLTVMEFVILLVIAGVSGALGQLISGFTRGGIFVSIALGFIGALLGTWIARATDLPEPFMIRVGDASFPLIWAIIGAALFTLILGLLQRPATRPTDQYR